MDKIRKFVVHHHFAKREHFDFRLEMDGVLKSWAIPKEPPKTAGIKRLAIQVEDHPLSYASFQGRIPEGMYGAGLVKIWDSGKYEMIERTASKLVFKLNGKKLKGEYCLIKFKPKESNKENKRQALWLFFKR